MNRLMFAFSSAAAAVAVGAGLVSPSAQQAPATNASPIFGVTIPDGYRHWELVAPAIEAAPLDELRAVVGNATAIDAYRASTLPFLTGRSW